MMIQSTRYIRSVAKEKYTWKNMPLLKNPQFLPNHYETLSKEGTRKASFWQNFVKIG